MHWQPTSDNINALLEPIRKYIHDLESLSDPAGIIAENTLLRDQNSMLIELYDRVRKRGASAK